ncbi:thioredoxin family protein [Bacillus pumilus]|uniref:thioredoxin family protein n=1 Tax=Bacillus pumilus TaxID=1408 RepID=UPI0011A74538|nr:thioredoxin family protein [Bacillus pumilus]
MKLLKFKQDSCTPCTMLDNYMREELGVEADEVINLSEESDDNFLLAGRYEIMKTPTLVLVDSNGNELDRFSGVGQTGVKEILKKRQLI